jgi:hypothetical protein
VVRAVGRVVAAAAVAAAAAVVVVLEPAGLRTAPQTASL